MGWKIVFLKNSQKKEIQSFVNSFISKNELITVFSSGSTGLPRKHEFSFDQAQISAQKSIDFFKLNKNSILFLCLDIRTVAAKMLVLRSYFANCTLICGSVSSNPFEKEKFVNFNFISLVPLQLKRIIDHNSSILKNKTILVGGSQINKTLKKAVLENDLNVYESFGMTETLSHIAINKIDSINANKFIGLNGVNFKTTKSNCLVINYPDFQKELIVTNDIVRLIDNKTFEWLGRIDFAINSGGHKIIPETIEKEINSLLNLDVICTKLKDDYYGDILVLIVEGTDVLLTKSMFSNLKKYESPKLYTVLSNFPRINNKVDRNTLNSKIATYEWRKIL